MIPTRVVGYLESKIQQSLVVANEAKNQSGIVQSRGIVSPVLGYHACRTAVVELDDSIRKRNYFSISTEMNYTLRLMKVCIDCNVTFVDMHLDVLLQCVCIHLAPSLLLVQWYERATEDSDFSAVRSSQSMRGPVIPWLPWLFWEGMLASKPPVYPIFFELRTENAGMKVA
jgi:hypothetical protein